MKIKKFKILKSEISTDNNEYYCFTFTYLLQFYILVLKEVDKRKFELFQHKTCQRKKEWKKENEQNKD